MNYKKGPLGRLIGSFAGYILRLGRLLGVLGKIVGPWVPSGMPSLAHFRMPRAPFGVPLGPHLRIPLVASNSSGVGRSCRNRSSINSNSSGGGITCVTIAEAMVTQSPLLPFSTGSKSEREVDIFNWAYQSHLIQFWAICIKFDFTPGLGF